VLSAADFKQNEVNKWEHIWRKDFFRRSHVTRSGYHFSPHKTFYLLKFNSAFYIILKQFKIQERIWGWRDNFHFFPH